MAVASSSASSWQSDLFDLIVKSYPTESRFDRPAREDSRDKRPRQATVGDPATVIEEVPLEEPCGSTTTTRFEFETLDVLKGGSQAPSGRNFAYPADAAMTRAMVVLMCRGDPVPSPIVDGYNGRATWESSHKVLLFLRVDSGGTYSFAVRGGFEDRGSP